ncbi:CHSTF sulfotransferase, partial [Atractosteus spatula]|uniref:Sulfotransferase n=2 Tax=Lepisosteidae TaxID=7915 RepID=W5MNA8_LEPOC|nr:PREDICTED: carbohydrate sulfotransferase 15 [Lepisosteus oculatus]XP_015201972.1 PREDICTED: carbohydrate sulfotransferase 15 [Lepisosteus oculatus]XP_015201973.1 PREDICTED: carbohydrate sulfotransferase 15 [Lepisosteus oculatus]XP_015201974.1 PREDICTED: carbohydrate sulfotransferase 15 [Lepisosteus oculatus]XP_015201975.1 PREDICTED: carbohydrate sulfotransferase 15 [Lepisosteus oculatus]MBN3324539.1 CHSTF sulfotransferase [Atractosteus spatula]
MTPTDYKYMLLRSSSESYRKQPFLFQVDSSQMNLFAILEVRRDNYRRWSTLVCFKKAKLYSIFFGLTVMFLIMASYILTGDKKGLLLTPSPYHFSTLENPGSLPLNLSSTRDYVNIKLVLKTIKSNIEFTSRQVPDLKELLRNEPHMFSVIPHEFLQNVKNPCWYEEYSGNITADPYGTNLYALYSKRFRTVFDYLRNAFREHLYHHESKNYRIRCLPYFYIIGQPKCGTTDLYDRLRLHPDVRFTTFKEPHWWTRKRFGIIRMSEGFHDRYPVDDYLDLFDLAAYQIQDHLLGNSSGSKYKRNIIIGEASASTMWDNNAWIYFYDNSTDGEPPFLTQDFIHAVQPNAKFIIMLRDPVERLYSDYLYFGIANKSAEDFHEKVSESLQLFEGCLLEFSMRSCVYNTTLNNAMPVRLHVGLYIIYLLDWLTVFDRNQILVLRLEDHASNRKYTMHKVFDFLNLGPLTEQKEAEITKSPASNTRRPADKNLGPMLPVTREILRNFYTPFNEKLAKVLRNDSFLWENHAKPM